ncbi:hypothetical protein CALCODRAFT_315845 [Calocera cornea HHB12733]|uniref:Uncharacterized protein n=1 Tax=Calocera cornea HHB12733 TaxID=1353952 RepID=A0A165FAA8_9BASI|nr:hypothetical protein CALCODRAFT_315845 [Calocera cornea HHB12733]
MGKAHSFVHSWKIPIFGQGVGGLPPTRPPTSLHPTHLVPTRPVSPPINNREPPNERAGAVPGLLPRTRRTAQAGGRVDPEFVRGFPAMTYAFGPASSPLPLDLTT